MDGREDEQQQKDPPKPPPVPDHALPGAADGADHVETFREGEVEPPADAPPLKRPEHHQD